MKSFEHDSVHCQPFLILTQNPTGTVGQYNSVWETFASGLLLNKPEANSWIQSQPKVI